MTSDHLPFHLNNQYKKVIPTVINYLVPNLIVLKVNNDILINTLILLLLIEKMQRI